MALIPAAWEASLLAKFLSKGFNGASTPDLAAAIAQGSVSALVGAPFTTSDVGTVPGAGTGTGTGVTGLVSASVSNAIFGALVSAFGQSGSATQDLCDAVADALIEQLGLATLSSVNTPVFAGTATIDVGSIVVSGSTWGSGIQSAAPSFQGDSWPDVATEIGTGCANAVTGSGTGTLIIAGSPSGPTSPGVGTGTGFIS